MDSEAGRLLCEAMQIAADVQDGITVTYDDFTPDTYFAYCAFREERAKYQREKAEQPTDQFERLRSLPKTN